MKLVVYNKMNALPLGRNQKKEQSDLIKAMGLFTSLDF